MGSEKWNSLSQKPNSKFNVQIFLYHTILFFCFFFKFSYFCFLLRGPTLSVPGTHLNSAPDWLPALSAPHRELAFICLDVGVILVLAFFFYIQNFNPGVSAGGAIVENKTSLKLRPLKNLLYSECHPTVCEFFVKKFSWFGFASVVCFCCSAASFSQHFIRVSQWLQRRTVVVPGRLYIHYLS